MDRILTGVFTAVLAYLCIVTGVCVGFTCSSWLPAPAIVFLTAMFCLPEAFLASAAWYIDHYTWRAL